MKLFKMKALLAAIFALMLGFGTTSAVLADSGSNDDGDFDFRVEKRVKADVDLADIDLDDLDDNDLDDLEDELEDLEDELEDDLDEEVDIDVDID